MIGPTNFEYVSFGAHPVGMKRAVMSPHAINAPMFGTTMEARKPP
jgi:hypothetical protein